MEINEWTNRGYKYPKRLIFRNKLNIQTQFGIPKKYQEYLYEVLKNLKSIYKNNYFFAWNFQKKKNNLP